MQEVPHETVDGKAVVRAAERNSKATGAETRYSAIPSLRAVRCECSVVHERIRYPHEDRNLVFGRECPLGFFSF